MWLWGTQDTDMDMDVEIAFLKMEKGQRLGSPACGGLALLPAASGSGRCVAGRCSHRWLDPEPRASPGRRSPVQAWTLSQSAGTSVDRYDRQDMRFQVIAIPPGGEGGSEKVAAEFTNSPVLVGTEHVTLAF